MMEHTKSHKYGIKDIYSFYKSNSKNPLDYKTFVNIWKDFSEETIDDILQGKDFNMPFRVGLLGIRKKKIRVTLNPDGTIDKRYLRPDWKATKDLWEKDEIAKKNKQLVFHLNKHFGGFNCKYFWDKSTCRVVNQSAYSLVMTRKNKRKLAKVIFEGNVDYYEQQIKGY